MNVTLWVIQIALGLFFVALGILKISQPRERLIERGMKTYENYSDNTVKLIGLAELLGGIGLILPWALDLASILTPIAAVALAVLMLGAAYAHWRRDEQNQMAIPVLLVLLGSVIAIGRLGD